MSRHVALLRGVNVGGHDKLPMKELLRLFEEAGCTEVSTYIQSGNVVFSATAALAKRVPRLITEALQAELGVTSPVITRTANAFRSVAAEHPFADAAEEGKTLHVAFLADEPKPGATASLPEAAVPGEQVLVRGREIYLHLPALAAKTKLTNALFDRHLGTISTGRNWNTVQALLERLD